jgi:hypothetical protein
MSEWVDGISRRFWGGVGTRIIESGALDDALYKPGLPADSAARLGEYARRWAYYRNKRLYYHLWRGGWCPADIPTEFNPVPTVAAFYIANVLSSSPSIEPADKSANGEALTAAVEQLWEWSNYQTLRGQLTETAAVLGDVFLKVAEKRPDADAPVTAVYMQDIDPRTVIWWEADERGFLTAVRIDTPRLVSVFDGTERRHTLVELWRKDWPDDSPLAGQGGVAYYEIAAGQSLDDKRLGAAVAVQSFDDLGYDFIPVVWARVATHWYAQIDPIDRYNAKAWHADTLNAPLWLVKSNTLDSRGAPKPAPRLDTAALETQLHYQVVGNGAARILYLPGMADMQPGGAPSDLAVINERLATLREGIVDALPEYRVATMKASTQLATETLELLLGQATQRVLDMRGELERLLVRAHMMAISIAQIAELRPDLFAPDRVGIYADGMTSHTFTERGVFQKSAAAQAQELKLLVEAGIPAKMALNIADYNVAVIAEYDAAAAEDALRQRTTLAAAVQRQRALVDSGAADNGVTRL